jgi:hypothetical protein
MKLNRKEIYRVFSDEDPTALIGLDARVEDGHLTWFDSNRDRGHRVSGAREEPGALIFETETGFTYRFVPLTKELYDRDVRARVELSPEFESTDAIRRFYFTEFLGDAPEETEASAQDRERS